MGRLGKQRIALIALISLWELFVLHEALAGQPLEKLGSALNQSNTARPAPSQPSPSEQLASAHLEPGAHLDLRPPAGVFAASDATESFAAAASPRLFDAKNPSRSETEGVSSRASAAETTAAAGHIMSPLQTLAHNFHQEGLPMARLFENQNSLVHLGLNQKGKPGLWIVQKVR